MGTQQVSHTEVMYQLGKATFKGRELTLNQFNVINLKTDSGITRLCDWPALVSHCKLSDSVSKTVTAAHNHLKCREVSWIHLTSISTWFEEQNSIGCANCYRIVRNLCTTVAMCIMTSFPPQFYRSGRRPCRSGRMFNEFEVWKYLPWIWSSLVYYEGIKLNTSFSLLLFAAPSWTLSNVQLMQNFSRQMVNTNCSTDGEGNYF